MLNVKDLQSGYGEMQVLWDIDLEVKEKSITVILGPNGAGKSTTLKTIFGTLKPWNGRIEYIGQDITFLPPHKKVELGMTLVPEGRHLFSNMTVKDNLYMGAYLKRAEERFEDSLELVYSLFPRLKEREPEGRNVKWWGAADASDSKSADDITKSNSHGRTESGFSTKAREGGF